MPDDLRELIEALLSQNVEFLVVGAHALAFYGRPRFTEALDLFLRRSSTNEENLLRALHAFGLPVAPEAIDRLMNEERQMIVLGHEPNAVDMLTFLDGVEFESAWENRVSGQLGGISVYFISKQDFIRTKTASDRPKDRLDLELLNPN